MKVASLLVFGLLALPALAQESRPAVGPDKEVARKQQVEKPAADRIVTAGADGMIRVWTVDGAQLAALARARVPALRGDNPHVAQVPAADQALLDIQRLAQKARTAEDLEVTLEALDEIEKAVMRARAALRHADGEGDARSAKRETTGTWKLP